jgi:hypothetical protein
LRPSLLIDEGDDPARSSVAPGAALVLMIHVDDHVDDDVDDDVDDVDDDRAPIDFFMPTMNADPMSAAPSRQCRARRLQLRWPACPRRRRARRSESVAGWFAPEVARQLHMIALEEDATLQALMAEAFNDVFTKRGKLPIA